MSYAAKKRPFLRRRIISTINKHNISATRFAAIVGISSSTMALIMHGNKEINDYTYYKLKPYLDDTRPFCALPKNPCGRKPRKYKEDE